MKILITGGAGFIGSHVSRHLIEKGHTITILDDLSTGKRENIPEQATLIEGDIRDRAVVRDAVSGQEVIIHLAAEVSVQKTIEDPERAQQINVEGSKNILEAAQQQAKKVILASSASVYGLAPATPTPESAPLTPQSPYAQQKAEMEELAATYATQGLQTCCLRFFNVYGPGQNPKSQYAAVIPIFIDRALRNEPLIIYGDGKQTRDFVSVHDLARAVEAALTRGEGALNIASGESISITELAELILRITKSSSTLEYREARRGDPRESRADIAQVREVLGFSPQAVFSEGLGEIVSALFSKEGR